MIKKGSLVRYKGTDKRLWDGKLLTVHQVVDDKLIVWFERKASDKWSKITINMKDAEEVC